uniref:SREBP regulating gene protein n=1 Tax=Oryza punctata TaxID=4537 RepID=A0A0E0LJY6_ORYPU
MKSHSLLFVLFVVLLGCFAMPVRIYGKNMVYTASETRNEGRYKVSINGLEPVKCSISPDGYCCYDKKSKAFKSCFPNASECWTNCHELEARV